MLRSATRRQVGTDVSKALRSMAASGDQAVTKPQSGLVAPVDNFWSSDYAGPSKASFLTDELTLSAATGTMLHRTCQKSSGSAAFSTFARLSTQIGKRAFSSVAAYASTDEAIQSAQQSGYSLFESYLTAGSDDRSMINTATATNKYHCKPQPIASNEIFRGSCTCNTPTVEGYKAAMKLFDEEFASKKTEKEVEDALKSVFEKQRQRIAAALELPEGVEVAICPSGSDAEYLPIAIARALQPETQRGKIILNIVTQLKEVGAGTNIASGGAYFSTHAPLCGRVPDGVTTLKGFEADGLKEVSFPARDRDGSVLDASTMSADIARKEKDFYPILHGVFGGKTGLRDSLMPPSEEVGNVSLGVIDACQGRFSLQELHGWLEQDSIVLFTGSKFYQAPPFCGAVLIPKRIADKLRVSSPPGPTNMYGTDGLGGFFSDKELPECLNSWKPLLRGSSGSSNNVGLALRWEAGLHGMESLSNTPDAERVKAVGGWARRVTQMVQEHPDQLDAWCVERSIVSIRLLRADENGGFRDMSELRNVYRYMSKDVSSAVTSASPEEKEALATCAFIGQPVDVADSHAIVRIALGSESLANFLKDPSSTLYEDEMTVRKLAAVAKYFLILKESSF